MILLYLYKYIYLLLIKTLFIFNNHIRLMNLIFDLWIKSKDKIHKTKILCKENYKVVIIIRFLLHQTIIPKIFLVNTLLNIRYSLEL